MSNPTARQISVTETIETVGHEIRDLVLGLVKTVAEADGRIITRQERELEHITTELERVRSDSDDDFNHAVELFNPPDDDSTTTMSVLDRAHHALEAIGCSCPPDVTPRGLEVAEEDLDACERCQGLGRRADVPLPR